MARLSRTVDTEREAEAKAARIARTIAVLEELLRIVKARGEELSVRVIAERIERHPRTVYRREETLRELLEQLGQKNQRRRT